MTNTNVDQNQNKAPILIPGKDNQSSEQSALDKDKNQSDQNQTKPGSLPNHEEKKDEKKV